MKMMRKIGFMVAALAIVSVCHANIVSWNQNTWGDAYATKGTDVAGVGAYSASYWNDTWLDGLPNPATDLLDNTGAATTIDISWQSWNTYSIVGYHVGPDTDGSYNREILTGYLNSGPAGWDPPFTDSHVTLDEIGYSNYDIVVYFSSDVADREGYVTDGTTTYYFKTLGPASIPDPGNALLIQATDTTEDGYGVAANYAIFNGLSGTSQTITVQMRDLEEWGGIAAIQIAESAGDYVTEPDPANGETGVMVDLSDRTIVNNLSWTAPSDPNIAEIKGYDIFVDPNQIKVENRDGSCEIVGNPVAAQYDPASDLANDEIYYWVVDTRYTRDDDPNLGTATEQIYTGSPSSPWSFTTITSAPIITDFNSVVVQQDMLPVTITAHVSDLDLTSATMTLLTDDINWPNPGSISYSSDVTDPYTPTFTLTSTDTPGYYKVRLTVTDATAQTDEQIAEIAVYANDDPNGCAAAQFNWQVWGGFNVMDFDQDCDVDLTDLATFVAAPWLDDRGLQAPEPYDWGIPYAPTGVITNGDFETGDLTGWWSSDAVVVSDVNVISDLYSAEWTVDTTVGIPDGDGIATYFQVAADTTYEVSATILGGSNLQNDPNDECLVRRQYDFANPIVQATSWVPDAVTPQLVTLQFTTGPDDQGAWYEFVIFGKHDGVYYLVDDVQITIP